MHPYSIQEKIIGSIFQLLGVTIFSIVMNEFIAVIT